MRPTRRTMAFALLAIMLLAAALTGCAKKTPPTTTPEPPAPVGKPFEFTLMAYTRDRAYNPLKEKLAEAIQQELAKSGVKVNVKALPWDAYLEAVRNKGEGDAFLLGWIGDNGDVDNFLYTFFHSNQAVDGGLNNMKYKSLSVDNLLMDGQQNPDLKKRAEFYLMAEKLLSQDAPWLPISHMNDYLGTSKKVKGLQIHPTGMLDFRPVEVDGKKELIFGRGGDSLHLDPALIEDGASSQVVGQIFEGLYTYKPGNTDVIPLLADGLPSVDEKTGTVYTIKLKKGITFSDGTPFNAAAVKYSFDRQIKGDNKAMPYASFTFGQVKSVDAKDDATVVITLKDPVAPFLSNLAMGLAAPIVSPTAHKKWGDAEFQNHPVGTGPFVLKEWKKDQQIVLDKNPTYWNKDAQPKLDRLIFKVIKEGSLRVDAVIKGEVDAIDGIAPADVKRVKDGAVLIEGQGMNISYMGFRTDRPPFNDKKLRQAMVQLVDRVSMVKALYGDSGVAAQTYIPPFMQKSLEAQMKGDPNFEPKNGNPMVGNALPYNQAEGKKLMEALGWSTTPLR